MSDFMNSVSVVAAILSALGGAFAAVAASRSAAHARDSQRTLEDGERRDAWRETAGIASEVAAEVAKVNQLAIDVRVSYRTLATFSGATGNSRVQLFMKRAEEKALAADGLASRGKSLSQAIDSLRSASIDDITRERISIYDSLVQLRAMATELEREHANIEGQCAVYRELAIKGMQSLSERR